MPVRFWLASLGHKRVIKSPCKEAWLKPWLSTSEGVSPTATARLRMAFAHYKVELYLLYSFQLNLCQVWARIGSMFHVLCLFCFASWIPLHSHTHNHTYHIYLFINLNTHTHIYICIHILQLLVGEVLLVPMFSWTQEFPLPQCPTSAEGLREQQMLDEYLSKYLGDYSDLPRIYYPWIHFHRGLTIKAWGTMSNLASKLGKWWQTIGLKIIAYSQTSWVKDYRIIDVKTPQVQWEIAFQWVRICLEWIQMAVSCNFR